MAEYIERKKLLSKVRYIGKAYGLPNCVIEKLTKAMVDCTAADVAEVVRCRDCKHFISEVCRHDFGMNVSWSDDFCSCGERKGESDGE